MSAQVDVRGVIRATVEQLRATGDTGMVENLLGADAAVAELIDASLRTIKAFEDLGKARGVAANHFARRKCEAAMVAQETTLARVGGGAKSTAWDRELGGIGGAA